MSTLREALVANMHDGDEGGRLTMNVKDLLDETCEIAREFLLDEEVRAHVMGGRYARALQTVAIRLGGFPPEEDVDAKEAEAFLVDLIGPKTEDEAQRRRTERDG